MFSRLGFLLIVGFYLVFPVKCIVAVTPAELQKIQQQVKKEAESRQQAAPTPGVTPTPRLTPAKIKEIQLEKQNVELKKAVLPDKVFISWWGGLIVFKRVNGQLYLHVF